MEHGAAMLLYALSGFGQVQHTLPQFAGNAAAFFFTHLIQPVESLTDFRHDGAFDLPVGAVIGGIESSGDAQYGSEIGHSGKGKLGSSGTESSDVSANNFAIQRERFAGRALQAQRNLYVAPRHLLFQKAPELHLERIGARRKAEVQVKKSMIDGFQGKRKRQAAIGLGEAGGSG